MLAKYFTQETLDNIIAEVRLHLPTSQNVEVVELNQTICGGRIDVIADGADYTLSSYWSLETMIRKMESGSAGEPSTNITKMS